MASFARGEVESEFIRYWRTGAVGEDWDAWADLFTEDADYVEHVLGRRRGREEIRAWIKPTMARVPELYTALGWYVIEGDRVVCEAINRRDDPSPGGGVIDFPGVTVLRYAGHGLWRSEEDYWSPNEATEATQRYREACRLHDPDHPRRRSRLHWPREPRWASPVGSR
jgi:limonene-1,2-epoxide hydrolase